MRREAIKTTIKQAIDYWETRVDECCLSVDWSEADSHCWRCGCERNLQRFHIIPHSLGGEDSPSNIVLLCSRCHADGPNVSDPEIMWDWIKAYKVPFYGTFWSIQAEEEYKRIYKTSVTSDLKLIENLAQTSSPNAINDKIKNSLKDLFQYASVHFGQPYLNTATLAGLYRMLIKKLANEYNVKLRGNNDTYPD
ncbi:MAG: HNH endonuclease [Clostridia bacterium]|nr:HNH endonuclease [Clostridia bacterium]